MVYKIIPVNEQVVFIRWSVSPMVGSSIEKDFVQDIQTLLDNADKPLYFLSDLRHGRITNIAILRQLGALARHKQWGAGASYANDPISTIFSSIFTRFANKAKREDGIWYNAQDAINALKRQNPAAFEGLDWTSILAEDAPAKTSVLPSPK